MELSKLLDKPLLRNLRDTVATIRAVALVVTTTIAMLSIAYWVLRKYPAQISVIATSLIALVSIFATYVLTVRARREGFAADFLVLESTVILSIDAVGDHHRYAHEQTARARAMRDGLRLFQKSLYYTGVGKSQSLPAEVTTDGHMLLDPEVTDNNSRTYKWIYFGRPIRSGEEVEVGYRQSHEDDLRQQRPYFMVGNKTYPTKRCNVILRVDAQEDVALQSSVRAVYVDLRQPVSTQSPIAWPTFNKRLDATAGKVEYSFSVENPEKYLDYGFIWNWPKINQKQG